MQTQFNIACTIAFLLYLWNNAFLMPVRDRLDQFASIEIASTLNAVKQWLWRKWKYLLNCAFCQSFWLSIVATEIFKTGSRNILTISIVGVILYSMITKPVGRKGY